MDPISAAASLVGLGTACIQILNFFRNCSQSQNTVGIASKSLKNEVELLLPTLESLDNVFQDPVFCNGLRLHTRHVQELWHDLKRAIHECQSALPSITMVANQVIRGTTRWLFNNMSASEGLYTIRAHREQLEAYVRNITLLQNHIKLCYEVAPANNLGYPRDVGFSVEVDNFNHDLTQRTIESVAQSSGTSERRRKLEIMEMATSYLREGRLDDMEKDYDISKCGSTLWELFNSRARWSIGKEDLVSAQDWCQRAVEVARQQFCPDSVPLCTSLFLLLDIFKRTGNRNEADRYKKLLPGSRDALFDHVYRGEEKIVSDMLKRSTQECDAALVIAVHQGHRGMVRLLLENRADSKTIDNNGNPVLLSAAERGFTEIVGLLLENRANVNATEKYGETSLMLATRGGHKATVQVLLDYGADRTRENWYGVTALSLAKRNKDKAITRILKKGKVTKKKITSSNLRM